MNPGETPAARLLVSLLLAVGLISATAWAGRYPASGTQTFTYSNGTTSLGDGTVIGTNTTVSNDGYPSAVVTGNVLRLTHNRTSNTNSSFKLPDLDPGIAVSSWDATVKVRMDVRNFNTPADGWAMNVGPIPAGNGDGEGGFVIPGGLVIAFDTFNNGNDNPSIEIFANGVSVGNFPQTFNYSTTTYRNLVVHWDAAGLDLTYTVAATPVAICTNLPTPGYAPVSGHTFAFSARTGGSMQGTYLDDLVISTVAQSPLDTGGPVISEFCADNENGIEDENGDTSDWIEIYNGAATSADLSGWFLTDTAGLPGRWALPAVTVPAYGYLRVFASGKNRSDPAYPLHTNFSLSKTAGYLALAMPNASLASEFTYGAQAADVSYGLLANGGGGYAYGYLETPTPGAANGGLQAVGPPAEDVVYLKDGLVSTGGLFASAFSLSIQPPVAAGAVVRFTTNNTPPTETSPIYATPLAVSATTTVRARVFAPDRLPGPIASRTFLLMDSTLTNYHGSGQAFSSNLPIIVMDSYNVPIDTYTTEGNRPHRLTYAVVIDKNAAAPSPDTDRAVITATPDFQGRSGTHVRGETSAGFPQKSYGWELWNNDNEDKSASILGFPAESDWVLHAPYTDKTLMRNFIAFSRMRELDGNAAGMGVKFVEVFFNQDGGALTEGDYRGVYVLVEKIKRGGDRVNIEKLTDTMTDPALISGGYIFARDKADPGDVTFATTLINSGTTGGSVPGFTFVEPAAPNAAQKTWLTNHVNAFEAALTGTGFADPATGYAAYINPLSFIDNQWFIEITKQIDGYRWSSYFHKDRNGKINSGPAWDYNLSLFNADYNGGDSHSGWYYSLLGSVDYFYWPRLREDPNYLIRHWDRYWELRRSLFESTAVLNYIDGLASQLVNGSTTPVTNNMAYQAPLAENPAMRHYRKWPVLGTYLWPNPSNYGGRSKFWNGPTLTPTTYTAADGEVDAMKSFLVKRLAWIDDQNYVGNTIYRPPVLSLNGGSVPSGTSLSITRYTGTAPSGYTYASGGTLYYTTDESDPRNSTGAVAGTAYTGSLVLANSATVKARLLENGNWSPLATASFIVNAVPASPANLVISELCYKPTAPAPGTPEYLAGFTSGNNFEYLELLNVSAGNVDLTGCQIVGGITFSFAGVSQSKLTLAPGERVLVVGNEAAFTMRYGTGQAGRILGTFSGNLSNSGEAVAVLAADTGVIASVTYGIIPPWPTEALNFGYSLVLALPGPSQVYDAAAFRSSAQPGGTPGLPAGFTATVGLGALAQVYTGDPLSATVTTDPAGLPVTLTYGGSGTPPASAGSYQVVATVNHPEFTGTATDTLVIGKAAATVALGDLVAVYDGTSKPAAATTTPAGLVVSLTYDGSATAPSAAGSYDVVATITDANHEGSAGGGKVIYDHASPIVGGATTLDLGTLHAGFGAAVETTPVTVTNAAGLRLDLRGSVPPLERVSLNSLAGIAPGQNGLVKARLEIGQPVGVINEALAYGFADDSVLPGASPDLGSTQFQVIGQVYSGDMVWAGPAGAWGDAARWEDPAAAGVHAAPGLDGGFTGIDRATFGIPGEIALDGAVPNLNRLTFNIGGHTVVQGSGATGLTLAGTAPQVTCAGANTLAVPLTLGNGLFVMMANPAAVLTLAGPVGDGGNGHGLHVAGTGVLVLNGPHGYSGATLLTEGTLAGNATLAGPVAVQAGASVNPGAVGAIGTLTFAAASISGTLVCDIGPAACDTLAIEGGLTLDHATLSFNALGVPAADGYVVATYTGAVPAFTTVSNLPAGYELDYSQAGEIRLRKAAGYQSWATANGLDGTNNGPAATPAGDGIPNLLKYVLNGDPQVACPEVLPKATADPAGNLVFSFVRRTESNLDTVQVFQYGPDLASWTSVPIPATTGGMVVVVPDSPSPGLEQVTLTVPHGASPQLYGRLKVSQ